MSRDNFVVFEERSNFIVFEIRRNFIVFEVPRDHIVFEVCRNCVVFEARCNILKARRCFVVSETNSKASRCSSVVPDTQRK